MNKELKLSDNLIAQIAKSLQVAILTGTDIIDNLRTVRVIVDEDEVILSEAYKEDFEKNVEKLLDEVSSGTTNKSLKEDSFFGVDE